MNETAGYFHSLDDSFARNGLIASSRATSESRAREAKTSRCAVPFRERASSRAKQFAA